MELSLREIECFNTLKGWRLHFAWLKLTEGDHEAVLRMVREATIAIFKRKFSDGSYIDHPVVRSIRSLLMKGGLPKDRCVTSFELMAKIALGEVKFQGEKPGILFRDLLSLKSMAPWSIMDIHKISFPFTFRLGTEKETIRQDGTDLSLKGCPVLCDRVGKLFTPVALADESEIPGLCPDILLVCYAPIERAKQVGAKSHLGNMVHMTHAFRFVMERAFLPQGGNRDATIL